MKSSQPTILTFRLIDSEISKYKEENKIQDESRAFLEFAIEKYLDLDRDEVVESVIDGSQDRGIDAIYIDEEAEERPIVYIFQSKYYRSEEKFDRALEGNALNKMQHAIENLILKSPKEVHDGNTFLLSKLRDIKALSNPRFQIVFCSNSFEPSPDVRKQFGQFVKEIAQRQDFFRVEYLTLEKLGELITPITSRQIDAKLKLSGTYFEWSLGEARVIVGRISGRELAELRKKEGGDLFDRNVRGYLSRKNNVNKEIFKTATDQVDGGRFFLLNNGVTVVCNSANYVPVHESPEVEISNLQIVNGGQTTNSIFEAYQANSLADSLYVLVKIIATDNRNLIEKITESTNTQTNVRARDLRSNDQVQKMVERILLNRGYYYETRKNKYRESPLARGKRIDMEIAAQAYYAFIHKEPANAKNKKRQLFGPLYEELFREDDQRLAEDILLSYKVLEWLRKTHSEYRDKYSFVKYAEFHSVALMAYSGIGQLSDLENKKTTGVYKSILDATAEVVREENEKLGDQYSHRLLFIDQSTLGRIQEILFGQKKKKRKSS